MLHFGVLTPPAQPESCVFPKSWPYIHCAHDWYHLPTVTMTVSVFPSCFTCFVAPSSSAWSIACSHSYSLQTLISTDSDSWGSLNCCSASVSHSPTLLPGEFSQLPIDLSMLFLSCPFWYGVYCVIFFTFVSKLLPLLCGSFFENRTVFIHSFLLLRPNTASSL